MSVVRNQTSLAKTKFKKNSQNNTVEWPKMHSLQNGIYKFLGIRLRTISLILEASHPHLHLSPIQIYVTIRLGISVSKNEIYVTIVLEIFVFENYILPSQGQIQRVWADTPHCESLAI